MYKVRKVTSSSYRSKQFLPSTVNVNKMLQEFKESTDLGQGGGLVDRAYSLYVRGYGVGSQHCECQRRVLL